MSNIVWHAHRVDKLARSRLNGHRPAILWFTGLSGAGKSTIAGAVEELLHARGVRTYLLDGDNVRHGLCGDLGFSDRDRVENIRRIGELAKLFVDAGVVVLTAFISPFRADRTMVRQLVDSGEFIEIHINASLETCEARDPKGLYKKARAGEIRNFTGIDSAYEAPQSAEISLDSGALGIAEAAQQVVDYLAANGYLQASQP